MPSPRDLEAELADPKYAHLECERRWLVEAGNAPDIAGLPRIDICDRYLEGTRLRLRSMVRGSDVPVFKLTKKYECADASVRPIVTAYLNHAEYDVFRTLSGAELRKSRYHVVDSGLTWTLDLFQGGLAGLVIVEIEAAGPAEIEGISPPAWAGREITFEPAWQGGSLAIHNAIPEQ
ncbi:hypothetical protein [Alteraurantiacibacter aquimixticola]|uniref:CYTH domain-containing protein n=1 Tax=Alteraurantiacibacter aquimixticola TaxID=2489173 RepID=A0A4T3EZ46_9SPHN|nr:hypothetical protein [Alteraurantiacibacter aquimixticola]TIX50021.1 hypothetical protein E5222_06885 [Alteraurantiacibacter aquimixticola]